MRLLQELNHVNVIQLYDIIPQTDGTLHMVFPFMIYDLEDVIKDAQHVISTRAIKQVAPSRCCIFFRPLLAC